MPTFTDVAKRAGVSTMTVSRVVNGSPSVTAETRARVEEALAETGYMPNMLARSLRSKRTDTVAPSGRRRIERSTPTSRGGHRKLGPIKPRLRASRVRLHAVAAKSTVLADVIGVGIPAV